MGFSVRKYLGGVETDLSPLERSTVITSQLNGRDTCTFSLKALDVSEPIPTGTEIRVYDGAELIFGGTVDGVSDQDQMAGTRTFRALRYDCVDFSQIADRRIVAETYAGQTLGVIAADIVAKYLAAEGVSASGVEEGPVIEKAVFPYRRASDCFNELSETTGYAWSIGPDKVLKFQARGSSAAPWSITDAPGERPYSSLSVQQNRQAYRNRQYVRAGQELTSTQTERWKGDGEQQAFIVSYPIAEAPVVTVNGAAKTVGIQGLETGFDWYWNKGRTEISQDRAGAALGSADTLQVEYKGLFPIIVAADSDSAIAERTGVEGGSGLYETVADEPDISSTDAAIQKAQGLLRRYGAINKTVRFTTTRSGLSAGQLIRIEASALGLAADLLISGVSRVDRGDYSFSHAVTALSGDQLGGWQVFFRKLLDSKARYVIRENEVLIVLRALSDAASMTDQLAVTEHIPATAFKVGIAKVGFSQVL